MSQIIITPLLKEYIDKCNVASTRTRHVLIVTITSSILTFTAFWNSVESSWMNSRLQKARDGLTLKVWDSKMKDSCTTDEMRARFDEAREFAQVRQINDPTRLRDLVVELQKIQVNEINHIKVPFFGIIFDINDLGLLGGGTFLIILLWFEYSLFREWENLQLAFKKAGRQYKSICFEILSMQQVLTVPSRGNVLKIIPRVLHWLPFFVQAAVVIHDLDTAKFGYTLNESRTVSVYIASIIFGTLILVLSVACTVRFMKIDKIWKEHSPKKSD